LFVGKNEEMYYHQSRWVMMTTTTTHLLAILLTHPHLPPYSSWKHTYPHQQEKKRGVGRVSVLIVVVVVVFFFPVCAGGMLAMVSSPEMLVLM